MGRNRFVVPGITRLELSDGDWIEVKSRLTYGEQQRLAGGAFTGGRATADGLGTLDIDVERYAVLRLETWLTDWSFCDENGKAVKLSPAAIAALDPDSADEITAGLDAHIERLATEKNLIAPVTVTGAVAPKRRSR